MSDLENEDAETGHMLADDLLLEALKVFVRNEDDLVINEIIKIYDSLHKWYA
jgi:hypothetical protein